MKIGVSTYLDLEISKLFDFDYFFEFSSLFHFNGFWGTWSCLDTNINQVSSGFISPKAILESVD